MDTVIIVIHLMVVVALIAVVLLQRSEGGALGIGGNSNFMTTRGQGNVLTRATAILAGVFFATSILLTVLARVAGQPTSILDLPSANAPAGAPASLPSLPSGGLLDALPPSQIAPAPAPAVPPAAAPPAVAPAPAETPATPPAAP